MSSPKIQKISPSYVIRCLLPQPCGTFIVRHPTLNDELISLIKLESQTNQDTPAHHYVILSIRVDETVYKYHVLHYRLPYTERNMQENVKQILEKYNRQPKNHAKDKFTPLKHELFPPGEDGDWSFDKKHLQGVEFGRIPNSGVNNQGTSTAIICPSDRQHDINVFIKRFNKNNWYFKHELSLLREFCYPSIITLYGQYSDNKYSYLVFEDGGQSLESCCPLKAPSKEAKMRFIANVGFQVTFAMMYLEKKNIVHRDLTAGNVLINKHGFIRIADFGHAIKKEEGTNTLERSKTATGENRFQFRFLAPECLPDSPEMETRNKPQTFTPADVYARFSSKSDIWSFGILLIQLMIENPSCPYPLIADIDIPRHVKGGHNIHPQPTDCSMDMYLVLQRCWAYEAKDRISLPEIRDSMLRLESIYR